MSDRPSEPVGGSGVERSRAASDDSKGLLRRLGAGARDFAVRIWDSGARGTLTFTLGTAAGIGMIVAEFLRVSQIRIGIASCDELPATENRLRDLCTTTGHAQHHWALLILGLVAVAMAVGASLGRSRPAAAALLVIGVVVLAIALIGDHSSFDNTRGLELYFDKKTLKGVSGPGYTLELIAGALAIVAGAVKLVVRDPEAARA